MQQMMHILAEQFVSVLVSQNAEAGRVAERASMFEINSVYSFGSGVEEQS
jgi:predicted HAD superfamily phosphohydrolase YqeG